jgi:IclR family acetate operon transcriptional repressor
MQRNVLSARSSTLTVMASLELDHKRPLHPIGSVENALKILVMLRDEQSVRVSRVAEQLGVARSTAHRLLAMLNAYGVVEQDPATRAYHPGPLLAELGLSSLARNDLLGAVHPYLERLSDAVNETVHLMVLEGTDCRFVDSVECRLPLRVTARVGVVYPAHATSGGKALLAELTDEQVRERYGADGALEAVNERTITKLDDVLRQLDEVRKLGYAVNWGESTEGISAVAMVQRTRFGTAPAAVAISAPEQRLPPSRLPALVDALRATTEEARRRIS